MKTVHSDNESSLDSNTCNGTTEEITDLLIESKGGHSLIKCNPDLIQSYNVLKATPVNLKGRYYNRVLAKGTSSQSMPNSLDGTTANGVDVVDNCDIKSKLLTNHDSPPQSPWFKTWPECCDKTGSPETSNVDTENPKQNTQTCDKAKNVNNKVSLNEALQNISLAYSPVTKQLHALPAKNEIVSPEKEEANTTSEAKKLGHRRTEAGSFSSTISSLSDPSPSGSLLDADDRTSNLSEDIECKQKKGFSSFFTRNVFSWKSHNNNSAGWKFFKHSNNDTLHHSPQHQRSSLIASSTALIQNLRPSNLPAKTAEEEERHRQEYNAMLAAAKKKEARNSAERQKQQKLQLQQEELLAAITKHFIQNVLSNWDNTHNTKKTRDMWWQGLPSSVRGKVWRLAIGNDLNVTQQLYEICLQRAQNRLNSLDPSYSEMDVDQESSMDLIQLDISRTFPNLCIFQEGGPYFDVLHSLLAAYVCYRPDVGYVQGMSFIAAILILNMDEVDAFVCFSNLLNQPLHLAAFTLNQVQMQAYYNAYNEAFSYNLPKLYSHFQKSGLTPDLYLLDWVYTIFAKAMPLDIACRVWDLFLRDGDEFLFRTALGVLHLNQEQLMHMDFLHGAQFLIRLPDDLSADQLFKSIQSVTTCVGKQTFGQLVERCKQSLVS